jgi:uncharacterized protein YbaP (TraB family)
MNPDRISVVATWLLALVVVLSLLPALAHAKDAASLDEQFIQAAEEGNLADVKKLVDEGP